jgi:hypothetical protein
MALNDEVAGLGFDTTLKTTAMGILPHKDPERALDIAFTMDIPFWPQLPNISYSEDTYVQTAKGLPGVEVDFDGLKIDFDQDLFYAGLEEYLALDAADDLFAVTPAESATYAGFLERASREYPALRGQFMGPISLCLMIKDTEKKPIIYRDDAREVTIRHVANRVNRHLVDLRSINPGSFVWVDEPGLEFLFTGITGYTSERAREDLALFLSLLEGPRGVHLCGNPDWDFLLQSEVDLLSLDAYNNRDILAGYREGLGRLLSRGGVIAWGIVPTHTEILDSEIPENLADRLENLWSRVSEVGPDRQAVAGRSLITPATCCLVNPDLTDAVEKAFAYTREVADILKNRSQTQNANPPHT